MKILATGDLHGRRDWYRWLLRQAKGFDVVVVAGDLLDMFSDTVTQVEFLGSWMGEFSATGALLLICEGNHDQSPFSKVLPDSVQATDFVLQAILHEHWMDAFVDKNPHCVVSGMSKSFTDYGLVATSLFYEPDDEGLNPRLWEEGASQRRRMSPSPTWLVTHHQPPPGKLGAAGLANQTLAACIEEFQPTMVFCGHDHATPLRNQSCCERIGSTFVYNAGYNPIHDYPCHIVLDTTTMRFTWNN